MDLIKEKYKDFTMYCYDKKFLEIGIKIIDRKIKIVKEIKNTKRNYVALIEENNENYVLKEPRNEFRIPQRKFFSIFKKGEALSTFLNINKILSEENVDNFVKPLLAIVKRKNKMICYSSILFEYSLGTSDRKYLDEIIEKMKEIHSLGYYHGDFNPSNFLIEETKKNNKEEHKILIIDTQGKRMSFFKYRAHYDMLTMQIDTYPEMMYPYKKDFSYWLALAVKKFKALKFIKKFKEKKRELRDKGWKI